ncbi:hypothetical protein ACA910_001047 [Epithemia clementina (nom. ined.)]
MGSAVRRKRPPSSSSSKQQHPKISMRGQGNAEDLRRSLLRRRQQEDVQLRKQRKEERLQARRFRGSHDDDHNDDDRGLAAAVTFVATSAKTPMGFGSTERTLKEALETFIVSFRGVIHSNQHYKHLLERLHQTISSCNGTETSSALEEFARDEPDKTEAVISALSQMLAHLLQHSGDEETLLLLHNILLSITASTTQTLTATANKEGGGGDDDNYYGLAPLRWSDQIVKEATLLRTLLSSLHRPVVSNILGNLVQDAGASALQHVWPAWSTIVTHLPATSYLCAAMAQKDNTRFASHFMQDLTTTVLTSLLQSSEEPQQEQHPELEASTVVDAAWILEGLSRREDAAVKVLCGNEVLMQNLASLLEEHTTKPNASFLFPTLKAIGNMAVACDGTFVPALLTKFAEPLTQILEKGIVLEGVKTAAFFLFDAGLPRHSSTVLALPLFSPSLIRMIVLGSFEWKREAVVALELALADPPCIPQSQDHGSLVVSKQEEALDDPTWVIWNVVPDSDKDSFLLALLDISTLPDLIASLSSIRVLDRFLRAISFCPSSLAFNHEKTVIDRLHSILAIGSNDPQYAAVNDRAEIALDLLDDFFEKEEEDEDFAAETNTPLVPAPLIAANGTFAFGVSPVAAAAVAAAPDPVDHPMMGRGRGRLIPAWMSSQQQQQSL